MQEELLTRLTSFSPNLREVRLYLIREREETDRTGREREGERKRTRGRDCKHEKYIVISPLEM